MGVAAIPKQGILGTVRASLGIAGSMLCSMSFTTIYVWTNELYPTGLRSLGMGVMQVMISTTICLLEPDISEGLF